MRRDANGDRIGRPATKQSVVTTGATILGPRGASHVLSMIEVYIEGFHEPYRKAFQRRVGTVQIGMTNLADRRAGGSELGQVAIRTSRVSGKHPI